MEDYRTDEQKVIDREFCYRVNVFEDESFDVVAKESSYRDDHLGFIDLMLVDFEVPLLHIMEAELNNPGVVEAYASRIGERIQGLEDDWSYRAEAITTAPKEDVPSPSGRVFYDKEDLSVFDSATYQDFSENFLEGDIRSARFAEPDSCQDI